MDDGHLQDDLTYRGIEEKMCLMNHSQVENAGQKKGVRAFRVAR